jgi:tetratricopeptide (TPR) repeat protein
MRSRILLALGCLALSACAVGAQAEVAEGERLLAENKPGEALAVFQEILQGGEVSALDRQRAALGEARAFLAKGDLSGAEARFQRLADSQAAKFYYLGDIAQRREQRAEAKEFFTRALEGAHGGDTAWRLATLTGCEARSPAVLVEAATVARRGPYRDQADALDAVAEIWRKLDGGASPARTQPSLAAKLEGLDAWPSLKVLQARTLSGAEADAAWALPETTPEPTPAFRDYAVQLRARGAREAGDGEAVVGVIKGATPAAARAIRAEVAASRLWRGDLSGALAIMKVGPQGPRAKAIQALYLELLGRGEEAEALRGKLGKQSVATGLMDPTLASGGDVLSVQAPGAETRLGGEVPLAAADLARVRRTRALLERVLTLHALDRPAEAPDLRSLALLAPAEPVSAALAGEDAQPAGVTGEAWAAARLTRALRRGDFASAGRLLPQVKEPSAWQHLPRALRAALASGRAEQARAFLAGPGKKLPAAALLAARADASLEEATRALSGAKGAAAAKEAQAPWGAWVDPPSGRRIPLARGEGSSWREPQGSKTSARDLGGKPRFVGYPAGPELGTDPSLPPPRVARGVTPQEVQ